MFEKYSKQSQQILSLAESIAFSYSCKEVTQVHLFLAFLKTPDSELGKIAQQSKANIYKLEQNYFASERKDSDSFYDQVNFYMEYSDTLNKILKEAEEYQKNHEESDVSTYTLSLKLIDHLDESYIKDIGYNDKESLLNALRKHYLPCQDLDKISDLHRLGTRKLDPLIGREDIISQLIMILSRRNKPNPILLGEPGVGKSFIVNHLAKRINENKIPQLMNHAVFELDLPSTVGGTKYRGEFEEKIKRIIAQAVKAKHAILFIDEIHTIVNAGGADGAIDFSNIIKPYLSRGDIRIIGATTYDEYERSFSKDRALKRRFQPINVNENTKEETIDILNKLIPTYEKFYHKNISSEVVNYVCENASIHLLNQSFPDKAIDILDNSLALCLNDYLTKEDIDKTMTDIYHVSTQKNLDIKEIKNSLSSKIKGQDEAIQQFLTAFKEVINTEKKDEQQVKGTFLLAGPSGVGKSYLIKLFSKTYFGSDMPLLEIDSSHYKDYMSFSKLFGNGQSYTSYKEDSPLIKHIKKYPHCIITVDHIERLSSENIDLITSVLNSGTIVTSFGEKIDCSNVIFVFTTNIADSQMDTLHLNLFNSTVSDKAKLKLLDTRFKYDFLSQLNEIIFFKELDESSINEIENIYGISENNDKTREYLDEINHFGVRAIKKRSNRLRMINHSKVQTQVELKAK